MILYGIPNCDTIGKARAWLDARGVAYRFHDWRKHGVDPALLGDWVERVGWEALLNRAGTTFRKLSDAERIGIDAGKAVVLMTAYPAMIRRPVLAGAGVFEIGFTPERYTAALATGD